MTNELRNNFTIKSSYFFGKIGNRAIRLVIKIKEAHLPVGPGKTPIKDCTGTTRKTLGIPCIHKIQPYFLAKNALGVAQFHPHWYVASPESLPTASSFGTTEASPTEMCEEQANSRGGSY
jgi:hypothetical protein